MSKNKPAKQTETTKEHYQEWNCEIKANGKYEKLKVVRERVMITDEQADILNHGVLTGGNTYAKMYFKASEAKAVEKAEEDY